MGLKDRIKKVAEDKKSYIEKYENIKNEKIDEVEQIVSTRYLIDQKHAFIRDKLIDTINSVDNVKDFLKSFDPDKYKTNDFDKIIKKGYENTLIEINNGTDGLPSFEGISLSEVINISKKYITNPEQEKLLEDKILYAHKMELNSYVGNDLDKAYDIFEPTLTDKQKDDIEKAEQEFDPSNIQNRHHITRNETEFNKLIEKASNEQEKDLINYAKDNILNIRDREDYTYDLMISEHLSSKQKQVIKKNIIDNMPKDHIYSKVLADNEGGFFTRGKEIKNVDKNDLYKEITENGFKFSDNIKNKLKESLNTLEQMTYYKDNTPLFNLSTYKHEEGSKQYGLKNICELSNDINTAVKEGNLEEVVRLTEEYKKQDAEMTKLMDSLNEIDTPYISGNISLARNDDIPAKYSENIKGVSKVNGLWHTLGLLKTTGISIDEFVENPTKSYIDYLNKTDFVKKEIDNLTIENENDFINQMTNNSFYNTVQRNLSKNLNIFRGFEFIATLDKENAVKNYEAYQVIQNNYMTQLIDDKKLEARDKLTVTDDKIKGFIITKNEGNNYLNTFANLKPYKDQLKEVDSKYLLDRLNQFKNSSNNKLKNAVKLIAKDAIKEKGIECKEYNELCKLTGQMGYKAFKNETKYNDIALSIKGDYANISKDGLNKDNIIKTCNYLKILDEQYNKRNWFGKHLRSEGRAEKNLMDKIKKDMASIGIKEEEINNFLQDKSTIDDLSSKMQPSLPTQKTETRKLMQIDIKDLESPQNTIEVNNSKDLVKEATTNLENQQDKESELNQMEF